VRTDDFWLRCVVSVWRSDRVVTSAFGNIYILAEISLALRSLFIAQVGVFPMLVNSKLEILCGLRFLSIAIVYFIITQVKRSRVLRVVSKSAPLWFVFRKMVGMVREQVIRVVMLKVSRYKGKSTYNLRVAPTCKVLAIP
jgi:hypothetical protein